MTESSPARVLNSLMSRFNHARSIEDALPLLLIMLLSIPLSISAKEELLIDSCGVKQQNEILSLKQTCKLREHVEHIRPHLSDIQDNVHHVLPDVVVIDRCGGPCIGTSHRCVPTIKRNKTIPVMLVMSRFPHGSHETLCKNVTLEEHVGCHCACPLRHEDCVTSNLLPGQVSQKFFEPRSCSCRCSNQTARHNCLVANMDWSEENCLCRCPIDTWQICSTGYIFDYEKTCSCVPGQMMGSMGIYMSVFVLILSISSLVAGLWMMRRRRVGIFREKKRERTIQKDKFVWKEDEEDGS